MDSSNTTSTTSDEPIIIRVTKKPRFPNMKNFVQEAKYESSRKQVVQAMIMTGVLCDYYPIIKNDPKNPWVKLFEQLHNTEMGVFRHYEIPTGNKKYYEMKKKWTENFFPTVIKELNDKLIKNKISESIE